MKNPIWRLRMVILAIVVLAFAALLCVAKKQFLIAIVLLVICWFVDKKLYVCPYCGAKFNPRRALNDDTICGICKRNVKTGDKKDK